MLVAIIGDMHASHDLAPILHKIGKLHIQHAIVVGDFGLWDHTADGVSFLDEVNNAAGVNALTVFAVGGNHENWDHWNWYVKHMPTHKGFAMVRRRVLLSPKVNYWTWNHRTFLAVGGAVSIDREWRLEEEARKNAPRTLWWPNEQLSDDELALVTRQKVDYLFTHDCSSRTPFRTILKPDLDSQAHRQKIDKVLDRSRPNLHMHGHMHTKYEWYNWTGPTKEMTTPTIGLECNGMFWNWGVLDTDTDEFSWRGENPAEYLAPVGSAFN